MKLTPEAAPIFVRVHSRVRNEKPWGSGWPLPSKWANFALVFDCETTIDIRQDLNFLWWRFCELKNDLYVCQEEGVVYADGLDKDSDSMLFVASKRGRLVPCPGGPHKMANGAPAVKAITWKQVEEICAKLNRLNPYKRSVVGQILKIEECNYDRVGNQHQLYGLAVSAKRYVVYTRHKSSFQIIKPSEHGLGIVYVPDKRKRYKPPDCKDQETDYPRWIVEAWERLLADHLRNIKDPENALVTRELWFGNFPAVMRIRVTTPNVMQALRKRDPGAGKPYNFALSPILIKSAPNCTLIAPFSKHPEQWLTQDYTEIHSGDTVHLHGEYRGKKLLPQNLSGVLWRHYLHPEDKSLSPDGERCGPYTSGLLLRRPIQAMTPFIFIGKEVERRAQEGEDISVLENTGPIKYRHRQTTNTRPLDAGLIMRLKRFSLRELKQSGLSRDTIIQARRSARTHPTTRARLEQAVEELEGAAGPESAQNARARKPSRRNRRAGADPGHLAS